MTCAGGSAKRLHLENNETENTSASHTGTHVPAQVPVLVPALVHIACTTAEEKQSPREQEPKAPPPLVPVSKWVFPPPSLVPVSERCPRKGCSCLVSGCCLRVGAAGLPCLGSCSCACGVCCSQGILWLTRGVSAPLSLGLWPFIHGIFASLATLGCPATPAPVITASTPLRPLAVSAASACTSADLQNIPSCLPGRWLLSREQFRGLLLFFLFFLFCCLFLVGWVGSDIPAPVPVFASGNAKKMRINLSFINPDRLVETGL